MSRASRAQAIARAAAYGGGGLVGAGSAVFGLLAGEAWLARRRIGPPTDSPLDVDGRFDPAGSPAEGARPLRYAMLGDSGGAGLGAARPQETPAAVVAAGLAAATGRPVDLRSFAVVGAQTGNLAEQVDQALAYRADVVTIVIGANDVTHVVPPGTSVRLLAEAVRRLQEAGTEVVVGTCPDLGTVRPIPHPLKLLARQWSRSLAAAQTVGTVEAGGRSVALADLLGGEFDARPEVYFGPDRFHPSIEGYRAMADAMLPSVLAALGYGPRDEVGPDAAHAAVMDVGAAAAAAADVGGAEVSVAVAAESAAGHRAAGRLRAALRLRRRAQRPGEGQASALAGGDERVS